MSSRQAAIQRVAFFASGWPPGTYSNGIVTYTANVRHGLKALHVESTVLAGETSTSELGDEAIDVRSMARTPGQRVLHALLRRAAPAADARLRTSQDIVAALRVITARGPLDVFEMEESFGLAELVCAQTDVPVVVRLHGPWFLNGSALGVPNDRTFQRRNLAERRAILRAAGVSAPSQDVLHRVREEFEIALPNAEVIPNPGMPVAEAQRWSLGQCDRDEILVVGRFDRMKGVDLAIEAFARLAPQRPSLHMTLAGRDDGLLDESFRQRTLPQFLAQRLPDLAVRARVHALGPVPLLGLIPLRRRAFVTVVPSRYETFSMTALEALASGSPLVASDVGGIREIVADGSNGLAFRSGDAAQLAAQLAQLLDQPERAAQLAARGLADFEAKFSPESVASRTLAFYERVRERERTQAGAPKSGVLSRYRASVAQQIARRLETVQGSAAAARK